ncbi:DUF881 domain-containing protein [Clostridium cochlearium]|uniref:DUF881 domain-containing protein n=1 Tax=Clostridium cochlearium TaxID=1494 RepID=UPI001EE09580|nr:DUF881 domain-containing protein [Clostridium cochlearium]MCG4579463.1 DUF881 domain-containing protein [Clostridium cochlearium]
MRYNEANIFVFIASIIIGILIALNISFSREEKNIFLNSRDYQNAYIYRNQLINDISNLNEIKANYNRKLSKYNASEEDKKKIIEEVKNELQENKVNVGLVDMEGPGLKIIMEDASREFNENDDNYLERRLKIIHNTDMIQVVNDLLNAGAEAISINGHRVISSSSIFCNGLFLRINGVQIGTPFYIKVIGNKEAMKNYILSDGSYVKSLMLRGIEFEIEEEDNLIVPAFYGKTENKYIKTIKD